MRTCIECGAPLSDEDQFCLNCGADVPQPETDNNPYPEENNEPVQEQPVQQEYTQQQPVQQTPQQPMQQYQQQQPMQQQAGMYPPPPGMYPQQPMQQPGMYPQQTMQQQPGMYQQPEQKQGSSNKTLLYILIPLLVIGAAVAILFATGVFSGKKDTAKTDQQEVTAQVQPSEQDQEQVQDQEEQSEEEIQPTAQSALGTQNVTLAGITFRLAEDYEMLERKTLKDSEACLIVPKGAPDRSNRLVLRIYPNKLEGINGITSEEIGDLLYSAVDANAGVFANEEKSGFKLDRKYKVHYDDNADGSYFPHSYTYLNWTDRNGKYSRSYTEATLVKRIVVSGSAIATNEGELRALTDIYSEVVQAANK